MRRDFFERAFLTRRLLLARLVIQRRRVNAEKGMKIQIRNFRESKGSELCFS